MENTTRNDQAKKPNEGTTQLLNTPRMWPHDEDLTEIEGLMLESHQQWVRAERDEEFFINLCAWRDLRNLMHLLDQHPEQDPLREYPDYGPQLVAARDAINALMPFLKEEVRKYAAC